MALPSFPLPPRNPAAPGPQPPSRKGVALAGVLGISIAGALGLSGEISSNESGGKVYLEAYRDRVGVWTIGDGLIRHPDGRPVQKGDRITEDEAAAWREIEIINHAKPIMRCLPQLRGREHQVRAIIDLSYNVGPVPICNGTIGQDIRSGDWAGAQQAIGAFNRGTFAKPYPGGDCRPKKVGGYACVIRGLTARREREQLRFSIDRPAQGER